MRRLINSNLPKLRWAILITIVYFLFPVYLYSQNTEWINFTFGDYVNAVAVEEEYVWVGTSGGLVCLNKSTDELSFYNRSNSDIPDNYVWGIAIDAEKNKWIGTYDGLAKFDGINWTIYNTTNSNIPGNDVRSIALDSSGNKWIGFYETGVAKFDGIN